MRGRPSRRVFLLVLIALVGGAVALSWRTTEADRVTADLESLAKALEFASPAESRQATTGLKAVLAERVADPVIVSLEPHAELNADRNSLLESYQVFAAQLSSLTVSLHDVSVKLDAGEQRATAKGESLLLLVDAGGVRRTEPRKFAVTLERGANGWVVVQARIAAPRIDQPEARP